MQSGDRTHYLQFSRLSLYQMSYLRVSTILMNASAPLLGFEPNFACGHSRRASDNRSELRCRMFFLHIVNSDVETPTSLRAAYSGIRVLGTVPFGSLCLGLKPRFWALVACTLRYFWEISELCPGKNPGQFCGLLDRIGFPFPPFAPQRMVSLLRRG